LSISTQDEDKPDKKHNTEKKTKKNTKYMSKIDPTQKKEPPKKQGRTEEISKG
jgi:hypothetical protein